MMKKIAVIGHFDFKNNSMIGAVVKARSVYDELINTYGLCAVGTVDIFDWRKRKFSVMKQLLKVFSQYKNIALVISDTSKPLMTLFGMLKKFFNNNILYIVVGGDIADIIEADPRKIDNLKIADNFFVETQDCLDKMIALGFKSTFLLRNFKSIEPVDKKSLIKEFRSTFKFCTFSRVTEQKGILDAINAIKKINDEAGKEICVLDIYGQIEDEFRNKFEEYLNLCPSARYCGVVGANESVKTISDYYCLLFPTKYQSEGIPGTIVDGFAAGVPAIASNWCRCNQVVTDGFDGIVYEFGDFDDFVKKIKFAINNQDIINVLRENCLVTFEQYRAGTAIIPLLKCIK